MRGERAYLPYSAGGFVILDISDVKTPKLVSDLPFSPPFQAYICVHTAVPLGERPLVVVNSEAIEEQGDEPLGYAGIVDISDETKPRLISLFPQPTPPEGLGVRNFYERPGRFGPHNQHQPQYRTFSIRTRTWFSSPTSTQACASTTSRTKERLARSHFSSAGSAGTARVVARDGTGDPVGGRPGRQSREHIRHGQEPRHLRAQVQWRLTPHFSMA